MSTKYPTALFLCHDQWGESLDRRICQQAKLLVESGYIVSLACFTSPKNKPNAPAKESENELFHRLGFNGALILIEYSKCESMPDTVAGIVNKHQSIAKGLNRNLVLALLVLLRSLSGKLSSKHLQLFLSILGWILVDPLSYDRPIIDAVTQEINKKAGLDLTASSLVIACDTTTARAGLFLKRLLGCSLWFDMHEYYSKQSVFPGKVQDRLFAVEEAIISAADRVYTVNPMLANIISTDTGRQIDYLANYLDAPSALCVNQNRNIPTRQGPISLLFHGGAGPGRNINKLVYAFRALKKEPILITFLQSGMSGALIREASKDLKMYISGYLPPEILAASLSMFDAIVVPYPASDTNNTYCSPNKLGDAIAFYIPILFNAELKYLSSLAEQSPALIPIDFTSVKSLSRSLIEAMPRLRSVQASDFDVLRQLIGSESQSSVYKSWIQEHARTIRDL